MSSLKASVEDLHPAYFAMVMATGIVSIAAGLYDMRIVAVALCWLNAFMFVALWLLTLARLFWHPARFADDLIDHNRAPGFFTAVAGTCILGSQWVLVFNEPGIAHLLWFLGIFLWVLLTYTVFTGLTVKESKPALAEGINGGWLIAVVATQSVSVLGTLLAPQFVSQRQPVLFSVDVVMGGHALHLDDLSDLLPLRLLQDVTVGPDASLVDQHGRRRNLHPGRRPPDPQRAGAVVPASHASISLWLHSLFLGDRDMVDTHALRFGTLETSLQGS